MAMSITPLVTGNSKYLPRMHVFIFGSKLQSSRGCGSAR